MRRNGTRKRLLARVALVFAIAFAFVGAGTVIVRQLSAPAEVVWLAPTH
jgi:hypothetical protein